jgi:spore maturation protein CgeB
MFGREKLESNLNRAVYKGFRFLDRIRGELDNRSAEVLIDEELERHFKNKKEVVLYVGIRYDYGKKNWGLSYEYYQFYGTLLNMDYSLIYFDYDRLKQRFGVAKTSRMLREAVYLYNPDILFYFHFHDWIEHYVWKEISNELPTKTIIMLADDHWRYEETKPVWKLFNLVLTTDREGFEKRRKEGFANVFLTQWGCNHFLYKNLNVPRAYDVSFVGRCYGERKNFVDTIRKKGINVATFGLGWRNGGRVSQADLMKIYNKSKIALTLSLASKGDKIQIKGRDFEAVACGSLLLTRETKEIAEYFVPDEEIITYRDVSDASEKIGYYLQNEDERERIAKKGYERFIREHTMEKRFLEILHSAHDIKRKK